LATWHDGRRGGATEHRDKGPRTHSRGRPCRVPPLSPSLTSCGGATDFVSRRPVRGRAQGYATVPLSAALPPPRPSREPRYQASQSRAAPVFCGCSIDAVPGLQTCAHRMSRQGRSGGNGNGPAENPSPHDAGEARPAGYSRRRKNSLKKTATSITPPVMTRIQLLSRSGMSSRPC
jgi:hypothetical protein